MGELEMKVAVITGAGSGMCFLASDRAAFITGAVLAIDGGLTAATP